MQTRRTILKSLAAGGALLGTPVLRSAFAAEDADVVLRLVAGPAMLPIRAGPATRGLRYTGEVLQGRSDALRPSRGTFGPTLELRRGERVRIEVVNQMREPTVIHWHGMIVPDAADGHPHQAVGPGGRYTVEFAVRNPAGTYLYHPHPYALTGAQTYHGLGGLIVVREAAERGIGLPESDHEVELVLQDRRIGADNQLVYKRMMMMDDMNGVLGDQVLVNGLADAAFRVAPRPYRLRIANMSNARIYKLAWSDERPFRVIGSDGGLFSRAEGVQERPYVTLFPFERVEVIEDFGARRDGAEIALISRQFSSADGMMGSMMSSMGSSGESGRRGMGGMTGGGGMMGGMMAGMMGGAAQGQELLIARFAVSPGSRQRARTLVLPEAGTPVPSGRHELRTQLAFQMMGGGLLNGRRFDPWDMTAVAEDERLPLGETSVWTFVNDGPGMAMSHPIHIHGTHFRVIERSRGASAELREGLIDTGYKDVVGIFAGEQVRVQLAPSIGGLFMYHCHNLEHEDGGMMRNVVFGSVAGNNRLG